MQTSVLMLVDTRQAGTRRQIAPQAAVRNEVLNVHVVDTAHQGQIPARDRPGKGRPMGATTEATAPVEPSAAGDRYPSSPCARLAVATGRTGQDIELRGLLPELGQHLFILERCQAHFRVEGR
jgi:hypothetical protein